MIPNTFVFQELSVGMDTKTGVVYCEGKQVTWVQCNGNFSLRNFCVRTRDDGVPEIQSIKETGLSRRRL